ncbi:peroxidase family protein [Mycolicibacterium baixiangningiae]|uniref:peroxidase family protein n=1 Tax=Mycolicibacterium baixiangningiae TaxID=2761578 RepID=UPI0018D18625|nr:heme peroxidase family protein [Mycolicibacterium baixiangningiae]
MSHGSTAAREVTAPRSRFYQGPFGRLFDDLEPWRPVDGAGVPITDGQALQDWCLNIANTLMVEKLEPDGTPTPPGDIDEDDMDAEFGSAIPAGYTYFGQFVDHDITFDPTSSLQRHNDPDRLFNFRTPRFDLDNLYGRGPDDQPYLYDTDLPSHQAKFLLAPIGGTAVHDLPRNTKGRALIGDPRNDENSIVSQLHVAFLAAHNTLVNRAVARSHVEAFAAARTTLRWLYQWVVWHDYVKRIVDPVIHDAALQKHTTDDGRTVWTRGLKDVYDWHNQPYMPVEFSGAAYRFGHSMVRSKYKTNLHRGFDDTHFVPIFDNTTGSSGDDLRGFRPVGIDNAIEWDWFLRMTSSIGEFPQRAHRIDTKLTNALAFLHEGSVGSANNVLASRNILRGIRLDLPSGPDIATRLGLAPIDLAPGEPASLWFYLLKEAETTADGNHLGAVGSIIVASVFAGLLVGDPQSWLNVAPAWTPNTDPLLEPGTDNVDSPGEWELASIIRIAGVPTKGSDFP